MIGNRPWTIKEGFLIGGGLIFMGLMLELSIGPVAWHAFGWPANAIALTGFSGLIALIYILRKRVYAFQFLCTLQAAIPAMAYAVVLTIVMGLTKQQDGGTWINDMLTFWPFVLIYVYLALISGLVTIKRIHKFQISNLKKDVPFLLNHLGLFIVLTTATLGNADIQRVKMITTIGETEWRAHTQDGKVKTMPIAIELKRFIMETYDDGTPKRFASEIRIVTKTGKEIETIVDVNKPYEVDGWEIYQYGYDTQMQADSRISILELVSDTWLPYVYMGIYMMLTGTLLLIVYTRWRMERMLPIAALLVVAIFIVSYLMPIVRSETLVPALQSPWFFPHILLYIVCYSLMGVATVMSVWKLIRAEKSLLKHLHIDNFIYIGLVFMTFGMMFGAFWAKEAWGHYWTWDSKETWAAITWLTYLVYIHYRQHPRHNEKVALWIPIIAFLLLQMCWWGINFLPAAQGSSLHTYN